MVIFIIFSVILGAALGSFSCCQAWRIYYKYNKKENLGKRSVCLSCGKKLTWHENIPILSWLLQKGKCRGCGKKIGSAELISEILGAIGGGLLGFKYAREIFSVGTCYKEGVYEICQFSGEKIEFLIPEIIIIAVIFTLMMIIGIYDAKWGEMPTKLLWVLVGFSVVFAGLGAYQRTVVEKEYDCCPAGMQCIVGVCKGRALDFDLLRTELVNLGGSILLLAGTYYILYKVSKEKWVGGGDWISCLSIALILGKPFLALLELTVSNILGLIVMLPKTKKKKKVLIPFGPFLIIAFIIIFSFIDII